MNIIFVGMLIALVVGSYCFILFALVPVFEKIYGFFLAGNYQYGILLLLITISVLCIIIGTAYDLLKPDDTKNILFKCNRLIKYINRRMKLWL
jgi:hypothetical protein